MERGLDLKTQVRLKVMADLIAEQSQLIIQMAEQIGNLNEMLQASKLQLSALQNPPISEHPKS